MCSVQRSLERLTKKRPLKPQESTKYKKFIHEGSNSLNKLETKRSLELGAISRFGRYKGTDEELGYDILSIMKFRCNDISLEALDNLDSLESLVGKS